MLISQSSTLTRRFLATSALLLIGLFADVVLNNLNVHAMFDPSGGWSYPATVPTLGEHGADLRILVQGSKQIFHGVNPYAAEVAYPPPPFAAVFFYPFAWMSSSTAYLVQYWVLIALNLASILLIAFCLSKASVQSAEAGAHAFPLLATGVLVTIVAVSGQFHGYGLEFALERGNFDSYVLFLVSTAITCMVVWPERVLLPIVLLSAASHLKIYPAILLLLPLLQSWRRALLPLVVVNLAMLFLFGVQFARSFLVQIVAFAKAPYIWPGNHSIAAYVSQVIVPAFPSPLYDPDLVQTWASRAIALVVAGLWLHGVLRVRKLTPLSRRWLVVAALSFPVMGALSSTSHDYKLVIYVLPVLVNLYFYCETFLALGSRASVVGIVLTLVCGVVINHSTIIRSLPVQETKFPALCLLLLVSYLQTYVCCGRSLAPVGGTPSAPRRRELALLAAATVAIAAATCAHVSISARGRHFAQQAAAKRALEPPPLPSSSPTLQIPDAKGYGEIKLQLRLPGTSAEIPEPVFVCGYAGSATLVYLRHLPGSQVKVGIEFWGSRSYESEPFHVSSPAALITVVLSLPCLYPDLGDSEWKEVPDLMQRERLGTYSIKVDEVVRLAGPINYKQPARSTRYYGLNLLGGSLVSNAYTGKIISAVQITQ